jgi:hypothetical protein
LVIILDPEERSDDNDERKKKKPSRGEEKLSAMDSKLKKIQNLIIQDSAKFYGYNDGNIYIYYFFIILLLLNCINLIF